MDILLQSTTGISRCKSTCWLNVITSRYHTLCIHTYILSNKIYFFLKKNYNFWKMKNNSTISIYFVKIIKKCHHRVPHFFTHTHTKQPTVVRRLASARLIYRYHHHDTVSSPFSLTLYICFCVVCFLCPHDTLSSRLCSPTHPHTLNSQSLLLLLHPAHRY